MHKIYHSDETNIVCNFSQPHLRMKVGAVVLLKQNEQWYFAAFKSLSRPHRGNQIIRGTVDPGEDHMQALEREIIEEYGRPVRDMQLLACNIYNDTKNSDVQVYYVALASEEAQSTDTWQLIDGDEAAQELLWQYYPLDADLSFLSRGHNIIVEIARDKIASGTLFS